MRMSIVEKLDFGDEVYWNDPDEGNCSRLMTIRTITVEGTAFKITDSEGGYLEGYISELS